LSGTQNATAEALDISNDSVTDYATVAVRAGLTREKIASFTGAEFLVVMRPSLEKRRVNVKPALNHAHYWLQRESTLRQCWKEYQTKHAAQRAYRYSRFCELYHRWLPDAHPVKTPPRKQVNRPSRA
jgi:hypothetical protein